MSRIAFTLALLVLAACDGRETKAKAQGGAGAPVATGEANAPRQAPAFAGQTRAPEVKSGVGYEVRAFAKGLDHPWGMAFLPDGRLLVSERPGRLKIVGRDGAVSRPVQGLPPVDARGQGGLLGLALDPDFGKTGLIYWSYAEPAEGGGNRTAVARGRLAAGEPGRVEDVRVIFRQTPSLDSDKHFGGRLVFARDGTLLVTTGERSDLPGRMQAQRLDGTLGKVVRINPDGSVPKDNPFVGRAGARPEIFSIGQRNIQAAALHPVTGKLWEVEHGARGGDEVNVVEAGKDYGWPTIAYGIEYAGGKIGAGITQKAGMEQPVYYWDPVIAPSGMAFYEADLFPAWKGSLFVGGLGVRRLVRLSLDGERVTGEEWLLEDLDERIRDVIVGPDGALYVATDSSEGQILRITPKG